MGLGMVDGQLAGIRVLDLSRMVSGPLCGRLLSDLGADVIKIEPPEGDRTRTVPPFVDGVSPYYAQMNAGKRNVCLDLRAEGAVQVLARLAAGADVLLENFRAGVLARFGLDAPRCSPLIRS
jgi:crotonobetainyl-CoA:carnitine CoA-transferase CaiB-like acyl-CoA transferase